jgi:glycosyltransferase involved in cell wall biosynthesis
VVHLSTVLLAGMAGPIARRLGVPVVATLSGEDSFLERLAEPHYSRAREVLRQRCGDLVAMIALNRYYAEFMAEYLAAPRDRIHVIPPGLNLAGHAAPPSPEGGPCPPRRTHATIGFLARICPDKGLHLLLEALEVLLEEEVDLPPLRVVAAGYLAESDRAYLEGIGAWLAERNLTGSFQYLGPVDRAGKIAFLQSLDMLCLPTAHPESKGLPVLEAWANGTPVVVPAHGTFPELVEDAGGGLLFAPHDVPALAGAIKRLVLDTGLAAQLGRRGHEAVRDRYHAEGMARRTLALYEKVLRR